MILFSIQDLFGYLKAHATMSGIQRVQAGIALHAIAEGRGDCGFILNDLDRRHGDGEFLLVANEGLRDVIAYVSAGEVDHGALRLMLTRLEADAGVVRPRRGDTIFLLGAYWGHGNTVDQYIAAKHAGVTIGAYVYDVIPITHPEFCDAALSRDFALSLAELTLIADFVYTISDATRVALGELLRNCGARSLSMQTVPLAHFVPGAGQPGESWPSALRFLTDRRYVAYVSTIEGRKNHLYVVRAWQEMIAQGVDVPDLLFVGRRGWRVGGLNDALEGTHQLDGRVHIVHDLSDVELNSIYRSSLFTVFTSFVEGWGLPIGESLIHGIPCIASGVSSMPEVGGELVDYVDPLNLRDGVAVFRRMIEDDAYRAGRRAAINEQFVARTWDDVGRDLLAKLRREPAGGELSLAATPLLASGSVFTPSQLVTEPVRLAAYLASPMRLALAASFAPIEAVGAPLRHRTGALAFRTDLPPGTEIVIALELVDLAPAKGSVSVSVTGGTSETRQVQCVAGQRCLIEVAGRAGNDGGCTVTLTANSDNRSADDGVSAGVALYAIGYAATNDAVRREQLFERVTFRELTPLR